MSRSALAVQPSSTPADESQVLDRGRCLPSTLGLISRGAIGNSTLATDH
jgi:hypothetical protein